MDEDAVRSAIQKRALSLGAAPAVLGVENPGIDIVDREDVKLDGFPPATYGDGHGN